MTNSKIDDIISDEGEDTTEAFRFAGVGFGITVRQKRLAEGWLEHGNGTKAARAAGYNGSPEALATTASRVLRYANVRAYIAFQLGESEVDERAVRGMLVQEAVTAESDGARVRAQELLGKTRGMFVDSLALGRMDTLDDVALARQIARGDADLERRILQSLRGEATPDVVPLQIMGKQP